MGGWSDICYSTQARCISRKSLKFGVKMAGGLFIIGISTQSPPVPNNGNKEAFVIMLRSNCLN